MEIDKTTLDDLSIFSADAEMSVFTKINLCRTIGGKEKLRQTLHKPLSSVVEINGIQQTLQLILSNEYQWVSNISNGAVMVIEKFYQGIFDTIPSNPSFLSAYSYKYLHPADFSLVTYSIRHCFDFIKELQLFIPAFIDNAPIPLKKILSNAEKILDKQQFDIVKKNKQVSDLSISQQLQLANFLKYHFKQNMFELLEIYFQLDAWYGMAQAVKQYNLCFPAFSDSKNPSLKAIGLYHLLLENPIDYSFELTPDSNFLFLTGANMAGKSTFIKSVGVAVFLAHVGMGVPAKEMNISYFDGLLSNINIADNITKGESYFYNEVQRIKSTLTKISDGRNWLILIDELFKGTNIQDAMKCSLSVIEGLIKIKKSLFLLSTHLYEISDDLNKYPNIQFYYFETSIANEQLQFSYQLKEGVSKDQLGYVILKKEGVVEMLRNLK